MIIKDIYMIVSEKSIEQTLRYSFSQIKVNRLINLETGEIIQFNH